MGQVQRPWEKDASLRWPNISSLVGMWQQEVAKRKLCHSNHPSDHTSKVNLASKTAESCRWMGERYHFKDQGYAKHLQEPCKSYSTTSLTHQGCPFAAEQQGVWHGPSVLYTIHTTSQGDVICWIHDRNIIVSALLSSRYVSNQKTCLSKIHQKIWKTDDSVATAETTCRDFKWFQSLCQAACPEHLWPVAKQAMRERERKGDEVQRIAKKAQIDTMSSRKPDRYKTQSWGAPHMPVSYSSSSSSSSCWIFRDLARPPCTRFD